MTEPDNNQPASPVRGIGSIFAALILIVVGLGFLLATACFGYFGIALLSSPSNRELGFMAIIAAIACGALLFGIVRGLIKMLKKS